MSRWCTLIKIRFMTCGTSINDGLLWTCMEWITTCNNEVFIVQISKQLLSYVIWFNMLVVGVSGRLSREREVLSGRTRAGSQ